MDPFEKLDMQDCPVCHGPGIGQEDGGWCVYVECLDCGCHTSEIAYDKDMTLEEAAAQAVHMWNIGKVICHTPGE